MGGRYLQRTDRYTQLLEVEGHLIDSMILTRILDSIMDHNGEFEIIEFKIGRRREDHSYTKIMVIGKDMQHLDLMLSDLLRLGVVIPETPEVSFVEAPNNRVLPEDFYCTTNHETQVFLGGKWVEVDEIAMDKHIIVKPDIGRAYCKPIREVKQGDFVVTMQRGIRVFPPERPRGGVGIFGFMESSVSSERPSRRLLKQIIEDIYNISRSEGEIVVVAGPAVIHTGAGGSLARIIELGYVDVLLSGNALAVHDIEYGLYGTSLGVRLEGDKKVREPRNHIAAINEVNKAGSIEALVNSGKLEIGIFYQLTKKNIPYVLAGSIRDDGPLPEVVQCSIESQNKYKDKLKKAKIVLMLASSLHSIAVGNMLTSDVKIVCIDINPAVVTKLSDRGSSYVTGIVSDVGSILPLLVIELEKIHENLD
jgi:lysine-ketoglutarate reductase/saccharopine dehydrogenase-like protein (TIGR00300 family)